MSTTFQPPCPSSEQALTEVARIFAIGILRARAMRPAEGACVGSGEIPSQIAGQGLEQSHKTTLSVTRG
jgi:hypothetical protein